MRTYKQLTQAQRYQIYALMKMGHHQTQIAEIIGTHKSTISRELRRNRGQRGYRHPNKPKVWRRAGVGKVSRDTAEAYELNQPLGFVLDSADAAQHSGKYFYASDIEDWNAEGRSILEVVWMDP